MGIFVSGTNANSSSDVIYISENEQGGYQKIISAIDNHKNIIVNIDGSPRYVLGYELDTNDEDESIVKLLVSDSITENYISTYCLIVRSDSQYFDYDESYGHFLVNSDSPAFTGTPTAPTASAGTNTTQIATTAFVQTAVAGAGGATITYGNTDLTAGTSPLATGTFYAYYV